MDYDTIAENNLVDLLRDKNVSICELWDCESFDIDNPLSIIGIFYKTSCVTEILQLEVSKVDNNIMYNVGFINPITDNHDIDIYQDKQFDTIEDACKFISDHFYKAIELRQKISVQYKLLVNDTNVEWKMML